jgi:hypothetical protein
MGKYTQEIKYYEQSPLTILDRSLLFSVDIYVYIFFPALLFAIHTTAVLRTAVV